MTNVVVKIRLITIVIFILTFLSMPVFPIGKKQVWASHCLGNTWNYAKKSILLGGGCDYSDAVNCGSAGCSHALNCGAISVGGCGCGELYQPFCELPPPPIPSGPGGCGASCSCPGPYPPGPCQSTCVSGLTCDGSTCDGGACSYSQGGYYSQGLYYGQGAYSPLPVVVRSQAMEVAQGASSCTDVTNSTTPLTGTLMNTIPSLGGSQAQPASDTYVSWSGGAGTYTINSIPPSGYVLRLACWNRTAPNPTSGTGLSAAVSAGGAVTWELGYTFGVPWVQTAGGDTYAAGNLGSYIPAVIPRAFIQDGAGGYPGVATYGTTYDFDDDPGGTGADRVSDTKDWLANQTNDQIDFYNVFYKRFGAPPTSTPGFNPATGAKPANGVYYVIGDVTINSPWSVGDSDTVTLIVSGNVTINQPIQLTGAGRGFVGMIAQGSMSVASSVGVVPTSSVSQLDGVYIANGSFVTGTSTAGIERFVGRGIFVAGSFLLQRDVGDTYNTTVASELFTYYPGFLITMPDFMREVPIAWQEVAP